MDTPTHMKTEQTWMAYTLLLLLLLLLMMMMIVTTMTMVMTMMTFVLLEIFIRCNSL
jgi:hypothetical protein